VLRAAFEGVNPNTAETRTENEKLSTDKLILETGRHGDEGGAVWVTLEINSKLTHSNAVSLPNF
jgi:hypothetical protein